VVLQAGDAALVSVECSDELARGRVPHLEPIAPNQFRAGADVKILKK
jgi:hypothetical protein